MVGRMSSDQAVATFLSDLHTNYRGLSEAQRTGVHRQAHLSPSDDPIGIAHGPRPAPRPERHRGVEPQRRRLADVARAPPTARSGRPSRWSSGRASWPCRAATGRCRPTPARSSPTRSRPSRASSWRSATAASAAASSSAAPRPTPPPFDAATELATTPINTGLINREVSQGSVMSVNITADRLQEPRRRHAGHLRGARRPVGGAADRRLHRASRPRSANSTPTRTTSARCAARGRPRSTASSSPPAASRPRGSPPATSCRRSRTSTWPRPSPTSRCASPSTTRRSRPGRGSSSRRWWTSCG